MDEFEFEYAKKRGDVDLNKEKKSKYKKEWWSKAQKQEEDLISEVDLERYLQNCRNNRDAFVLLFLYYTGMRPSELVKLKWRYVKIDENKIGVFILTTKHGVDRWFYFPVTKFNQIIVDKRKSLQRNELDNYVIEGWRNWWNIRDCIYKITNNEMTPYFFRHNRFSKLANKGVDIYTLKRLKGAKTLKSTEVYLRLAGSDAKKVYKLVD